MEFKTIEEVKEFLTSTKADTLGAIVFIDEDGEQASLPFDEFVEKVGLEKAAQFVFDNQQQMKQVIINKKEASALLERFMNDPESLTEEERIPVYMTLDSIKGERSSYLKSLEYYEFITKYLLENDNVIFKRYSGLLALLLTYIETALVASSNLSQFSSNKIAMNEIIKDITSQITIPEGVDEATLMLGLIHVIGEKFIHSKSSFNNMDVNYDKMIDTMGLTKAFMYECPSCEDGDCSICNKKRTVDLTDIDISHNQNGRVINEILSNLKDSVTESCSVNKPVDIKDLFKEIPNIKNKEQNPLSETKAATKNANIVDIRARLKKN